MSYKNFNEHPMLDLEHKYGSYHTGFEEGKSVKLLKHPWNRVSVIKDVVGSKYHKRAVLTLRIDNFQILTQKRGNPKLNTHFYGIDFIEVFSKRAHKINRSIYSPGQFHFMRNMMIEIYQAFATDNPSLLPSEDILEQAAKYTESADTYQHLKDL